jgi:hypothetical protein
MVVVLHEKFDTFFSMFQLKRLFIMPLRSSAFATHPVRLPPAAYELYLPKHKFDEKTSCPRVNNFNYYKITLD